MSDGMTMESMALSWMLGHGCSSYWTYPLFHCLSITHRYTLFCILCRHTNKWVTLCHHSTTH